MSIKNRLSHIRLENADKCAVIAASRTINFAQLSEYVAACRSKMPYTDTPIMICVSCRLKTIILMLTAIEISTPFIPIDTDKSDAAVGEIKQNFAKLLVVNDLSLENGQCVYQLECHPKIDTLLDIDAFDDLMSVMFTSGSTSKSKGVLVPSSAVENLLSSPQFIPLIDDEVFATYSSLSFDASTFEIFTPLLNGKRLVILDKVDVIDTILLKNKVVQQ